MGRDERLIASSNHNESLDYRQLVHHDRVHGSVYTSDHIYKEELERIWFHSWVAIGHDSEVPSPGDFVRRSVAGQPLLMSRGHDDVLRVFFNRCPHRGNMVCEAQTGNASAFTCSYHGWTFRNSGELRVFSGPKGYQDEDPSEYSLNEVPRVDTYQGFVFISLNPDCQDLTDHLGLAAKRLDRLVEFAPSGRIELSAGMLRHRNSSNWKIQLENVIDGYHVQSVHRSVLSTVSERLGDPYTDSSGSRARYLGNGHTELDLTESYRQSGVPMRWLSEKPGVHDYPDTLRGVRGVERADELLAGGPPHIAIWPNLLVLELFVVILDPISARETIQWHTPILYGGAPDLNRRILRAVEGAIGSAGLLIADDTAINERNQAALEAREPEWLVLRRGLKREMKDAEGCASSEITDETPNRGFFEYYATVMDDPTNA